ncbi:ribbon-helix-helix protein, CopG family [Marmoricola sp. RAF53]|uniref:ribbon-helix-helix protein, CopG family n=1 Tax=Marmoricola sp. RAF53 TaxID=3233059 RepID=UPI003F9BE068
MTLRIDDELERALNDLAAREGTSKQEVIKRAVIDRRDRTVRRELVDRIASEALVDYAEALDRLGQA